MIEQEGVQIPDLKQLATVEKAKTEPKQAAKKKTPINWGLLLLAAIAGGSYLWEKAKKKKIAEAQAKTYRDRLLPPVATKITLPLETSGSPESRLRAMGEFNTGSNPTARAEHKEI